MVCGTISGRPGLAHAPGDQLRVLGAEVDHQDRVVHDREPTDAAEIPAAARPRVAYGGTVPPTDRLLAFSVVSLVFVAFPVRASCSPSAAR